MYTVRGLLADNRRPLVVYTMVSHHHNDKVSYVRLMKAGIICNLSTHMFSLRIVQVFSQNSASLGGIRTASSLYGFSKELFKQLLGSPNAAGKDQTCIRIWLSLFTGGRREVTGNLPTLDIKSNNTY